MIWLALGSFLSGCSSAQKSSEISAAYVPTSEYKMMSCDNLANEARRVRRSVADLEIDVDEAYDTDKTAEVITWVLFWPAAFAMDGNKQEASRLSEAKGQAEAIRSALIQKGCEY